MVRRSCILCFCKTSQVLDENPLVRDKNSNLSVEQETSTTRSIEKKRHVTLPASFKSSVAEATGYGQDAECIPIKSKLQDLHSVPSYVGDLQESGPVRFLPGEPDRRDVILENNNYVAQGKHLGQLDSIGGLSGANTLNASYSSGQESCSIQRQKSFTCGTRPVSRASSFRASVNVMETLQFEIHSQLQLTSKQDERSVVSLTRPSSHKSVPPPVLRSRPHSSTGPRQLKSGIEGLPESFRAKSPEDVPSEASISPEWQNSFRVTYRSKSFTAQGGKSRKATYVAAAGRGEGPEEVTPTEELAEKQEREKKIKEHQYNPEIPEFPSRNKSFTTQTAKSSRRVSYVDDVTIAEFTRPIEVSPESLLIDDSDRSRREASADSPLRSSLHSRESAKAGTNYDLGNIPPGQRTSPGKSQHTAGHSGLSESRASIIQQELESSSKAGFVAQPEEAPSSSHRPRSSAGSRIVSRQVSFNLANAREDRPKRASFVGEDRRSSRRESEKDDWNDNRPSSSMRKERSSAGSRHCVRSVSFSRQHEVKVIGDQKTTVVAEPPSTQEGEQPQVEEVPGLDPLVSGLSQLNLDDAEVEIADESYTLTAVYSQEAAQREVRGRALTHSKSGRVRFTEGTDSPKARGNSAGKAGPATF